MSFNSPFKLLSEGDSALQNLSNVLKISNEKEDHPASGFSKN